MTILVRTDLARALLWRARALSPRPMPLLLVLLVVVPLVEVYLLVLVARQIGFWPTVSITIATAILGSYLARREGTRVWRAWVRSLEELRSPTAGILEGLMILVGGTLLLTPGLITDAIGFSLLVPWTRRALLQHVEKAIDKHLHRVRVRKVSFGPNLRQEGFAPSDPRNDFSSGGYRPDVVDTTSEPVSDEPKQLERPDER